jgi:hypothetical protein
LTLLYSPIKVKGKDIPVTGNGGRILNKIGEKEELKE